MTGSGLGAYEKSHDIKPTLELFMKEYASLKKKLGDYKKHEM